MSNTSIYEKEINYQYDNSSGGIFIGFEGKKTSWDIIRKVKPRRQKVIKKFCEGPEEEQAKNLILEGENLQAMVSLYKYRGQIDLIVADPPYNTGNDFRYNDKWDKDPNDPDLGDIVPEDDGSKHTKWLKFMTPRIWMMKEMLTKGGVLAICIDHRELFRLGMLLDEIFLEKNRIGIINWQKTYAAKSGNQHLSTATEYVLIYANDINAANTALLPRTEAMNAKYKSIDNDPELWRSDNPIAKDYSSKSFYGIQSPFTGEMHYPTPNSHWRYAKKDMKKWLSEWGTKYSEINDPNCEAKSLVIKGSKFIDDKLITPPHLLQEAIKKARKIYNRGNWPYLYFLKEGYGRPATKRYLNKVKKGIIPLTYWADEDYESPFFLDSQSWDHEESGHSQSGIRELDAILGKNHNFETVKPLKLITKIIQLWCPPNGIVLDPFAGSGTTGHAVLFLNKETGSNRKFILIEQGRSEKSDPYARTLTVNRIKRVITGSWYRKKTNPLGGGFRFTKLMQKVDAKAVMALEREEMVDLLLTSHWDIQNRASSYLERLPAGKFQHLIARNSDNEGYFLIWQGKDKPSELDIETFEEIIYEAKQNNLNPRYHVYACMWTYQGPNIEFYKIPDRILDHLGFNSMDAYNNSKEV